MCVTFQTGKEEMSSNSLTTRGTVSQVNQHYCFQLAELASSTIFGQHSQLALADLGGFSYLGLSVSRVSQYILSFSIVSCVTISSQQSQLALLFSVTRQLALALQLTDLVVIYFQLAGLVSGSCCQLPVLTSVFSFS